MVRFLKRGPSLDKLLRGGRQLSMNDRPSRHASSLDGSSLMGEERGSFKGRSAGQMPEGAAERGARSRLGREADAGGCPESELPHHPSEMELMKEKFAKLLLGEDMSGGGKGVSSALALSNAITNLAASVFEEHRRLEPMPPETKARWKKEIDWLLSVTDHIVEFVPSKQTAKDGTEMEIMTTQQRSDLHLNIPALRKLDNMLLDYLENFKDQNEFWYIKRDLDDSEKSSAQRKDEKWWLPTVRIPASGLSDVTRKWLQYQKEKINQVLKAAMAINAQVLSEMEIPENYIDSLPKNGRASLGDAIYRGITIDNFNPEQFLNSLDLSTERKILDFKNRIDASIIIWKRKMTIKDGKSSWGSGISLEKREQFEERAETILVLLKQRFPGLPQSSLDINKIQYNKDVGHSVLQSYSRVLESLAYNMMSRIEDVLEADAVAQNPSHPEPRRQYCITDCDPMTGMARFPNPAEEIQKLNNMEAHTPMTLFDFMNRHEEEESQEPAEAKKKVSESTGDVWFSEGLKVKKPRNIITARKFSYIERLETLGGARSPTARH